MADGGVRVFERRALLYLLGRDCRRSLDDWKKNPLVFILKHRADIEARRPHACE